jgi:hypothetical protein
MAGKLTRQELAPALRQELDDVQLYIDGSNNLAYEAHMQNRSNPHVVTKVQVGLGSVVDAEQATKADFDTHVASRNPHNTTPADIGAVDEAFMVTAGAGLLGGGELSGDSFFLSVQESWFNDRYLTKTGKAFDANKLDGYNHDDFMKHGDTFLSMGNNDGIRYDDTNQPGEFYFRLDDSDKRAYHSGNLRYGTGKPSGGKNGDIYIQI